MRFDRSRVIFRSAGFLGKPAKIRGVAFERWYCEDLGNFVRMDLDDQALEFCIVLLGSFDQKQGFPRAYALPFPKIAGSDTRNDRHTGGQTGLEDLVGNDPSALFARGGRENKDTGGHGTVINGAKK